MDGDNRIPVGLFHIENAADQVIPGTVDEDIEGPEALYGGINDTLAARHRGDAVIVGYGGPARLLYFIDHFIGETDAVGIRAEIIDDDASALLCQKQTDRFADTSGPCPGHDRRFSF